MSFATSAKIAAVDWGRALRGIASSPVSLLPFLFVTKEQFGELMTIKRAPGGFLSKKAQIYSAWVDGKDCDAAMVSYLMYHALKVLEKLPDTGTLHLLIVSGDSDFMPAVNLIKHEAAERGRSVNITFASRNASTSKLIKNDSLGLIDRYVDLTQAKNDRRKGDRQEQDRRRLERLVPVEMVE